MKTVLSSVCRFAALASITMGCAGAQIGKPQPSGSGGSAGRNSSVLEGPQNCRQFKGGTICRVGGEISAPRLIFPEQRDQQQPTLFANLSNIACPCTAVLWVVVGRDGLVHYPQLVRHLDAEGDRRAIEWVKKWKFQPARKGNKSVAVETNLEVMFH